MLYDPAVIDSYIQLRDKIVSLFEEGKLKQKTYYEAIGFNKVTFAKRLKDKSFSPEELTQLVNKINSEYS